MAEDEYSDEERALRRLVGAVLAPEAFDRWMETPIPALGGVSPAHAIFDGHLDAVFNVAERYSNPSYS